MMILRCEGDCRKLCCPSNERGKSLNKDKKLLVTAKPEADESFMGYILRLTELNNYENPSWILKIVELDDTEQSETYGFLSRPDRYLTHMSKITSVSQLELSKIIYPVIETSNNTSLCTFFGHLLPKYVIRFKHPKICPSCLLENPYCRRIWELSIVTTCPIHKCLLIDECPRCEKHITWNRKEVSVCSCNFDWREAPHLSVKESELKVTDHVYRLCGLPDNKSGRPDQNSVQLLPLKDLLTALFFIAGQYQGISSATSKQLIKGARNKDFHALFTKAYRVFENWPNNYYQFLDWRVVQERTILPIYQRLKSTLYRDFGRFYIGLYNILEPSQFDFMREAFVDYLIQTWDGGFVANSKQQKGTEGNVNSRYLSKVDVKRLLEADQMDVERHIRTGKLKTLVRSKGKKRLILIELKNFAKLRRAVNPISAK